MSDFCSFNFYTKLISSCVSVGRSPLTFNLQWLTGCFLFQTILCWPETVLSSEPPGPVWYQQSSLCCDAPRKLIKRKLLLLCKRKSLPLQLSVLSFTVIMAVWTQLEVLLGLRVEPWRRSMVLLAPHMNCLDQSDVAVSRRSRKTGSGWRGGVSRQEETMLMMMIKETL